MKGCFSGSQDCLCSSDKPNKVVALLIFLAFQDLNTVIRKESAFKTLFQDFDSNILSMRLGQLNRRCMASVHGRAWDVRGRWKVC